MTKEQISDNVRYMHHHSVVASALFDAVSKGNYDHESSSIISTKSYMEYEKAQEYYDKVEGCIEYEDVNPMYQKTFKKFADKFHAEEKRREQIATGNGW